MRIDKEVVMREAEILMNHIFSLPEIDCIKIRDVIIKNGKDKAEHLREAIDKSYHDCCSDVDLSVVVKISDKDSVTPAEYMKHKERFGVTADKCLGFCFVPENNMYRIMFKNGMRYDFGFEFVYDSDAELIELGQQEMEQNHPDWSMENVNRFWFVQIQALAKLYRKDYLISSHLANMNLNETLVQQMVLRDMEHGTNHHRYGYEETIAYVENLHRCPIKTGKESFDQIADAIYCAGITYDELTLKFYPEYQGRSADFMKIWNCYEQNRRESGE